MLWVLLSYGESASTAGVEPAPSGFVDRRLDPFGHVDTDVHCYGARSAVDGTPTLRPSTLGLNKRCLCGCQGAVVRAACPARTPGRSRTPGYPRLGIPRRHPGSSAIKDRSAPVVVCARSELLKRSPVRGRRRRACRQWRVPVVPATPRAGVGRGGTQTRHSSTRLSLGALSRRRACVP